MSSTSSAPPACDPLSLLHFAPNRRPHAHSSRWRAPVPYFVLRLLMRAAASFTRTQGQGECLLHAGMTMPPFLSTVQTVTYLFTKYSSYHTRKV